MNKDLKKPLIMDGAMGTELMRRGIELPLPLWSSMSNINQYDQVMNIHKDYIEAGSILLLLTRSGLHQELLLKLDIHRMNLKQLVHSVVIWLLRQQNKQ